MTNSCVYSTLQLYGVSCNLYFQSHPEVIEAAKKALDDYGAGLSSTRFICGTQVNI